MPATDPYWTDQADAIANPANPVGAKLAALFLSLPAGGVDGQIPVKAGAATAWSTLYSQLVDAPSAPLSANWSSLANTTTQVVGGTGAGGLIIPLPIVPSTRRCKIKIKIQVYSTFGAGNSNVYGSLGANANGLGNYNAANIYASGATTQTVWDNTAWMTNQDLSVQQYASMTVSNDASTVIAFSANGFRTSLLVEVYA